MKARKPYLNEALFSVLGLIIVMSVGLIKYKVDPHIPMLIGSLFASIVAVKIGYKWEDIEKGMLEGITQLFRQ